MLRLLAGCEAESVKTGWLISRALDAGAKAAVAADIGPQTVDFSAEKKRMLSLLPSGIVTCLRKLTNRHPCLRRVFLWRK